MDDRHRRGKWPPEESPFRGLGGGAIGTDLHAAIECRRWGRWWSWRHQDGRPSPSWCNQWWNPGLEGLGGGAISTDIQAARALTGDGGGGGRGAIWMDDRHRRGVAAGGIPVWVVWAAVPVSARLHVQLLGPLVMGALVVTTEEAALMGTWMVTFWSYPCSSVTLIVVVSVFWSGWV